MSFNNPRLLLPAEIRLGELGVGGGGSDVCVMPALRQANGGALFSGFSGGLTP